MWRHRVKMLSALFAGCLVPSPLATPQDAPALRAAASAGSGVPEGLTTSDWSSIRDVYEAGRHAAVPVEGGLRARNPGQQWTTIFDGSGFLTTPDEGGWTWGLALVRYGWGDDLPAVSRPERVTADGDRIVYAWDGRLEEWYVNGRRGLEHGYTLTERPDDASAPLALEVAIRGNLVPVVSADGHDVRFNKAGGDAALIYADLAVFDACGNALSACWEAVGNDRLRLHVDDRGARYPLTIDPIAQQAYLKASNTGGGDGFGRSISISGDTVVVGAWHEDSSAKGVNGDGSNNNSGNSGAAYVFVRDGTSWSQQAYLKASNTEAGDSFGFSVAVSGDTIVVGAHFEGSSAIGVDGDGSNNYATESGAAYVFERSGTTWSQQAYLKASNTGAGDNFGFSVATSGDTVVVGARYEQSNATGVNGDESNNSSDNSGAAYVFTRSKTTWSQQAYLKASNTGEHDWFGEAVAISGDTIVVGSRLEDSNATGVNGNDTNNSADAAGAAYVFTRSGTAWSQQAYLKASNTDANDTFGQSVAVSGNTVVVGATGEDSSATGVDGDGSNSIFTNQSGAAYVFGRTGNDWNQEAYLKASNTGAADVFGWSAAISGDKLIVGARKEESRATGVDGDQSDNSAPGAGAAYVFVRSGTTWTQDGYLKASNTEAGDHFGWSVSISGDSLVVSGPGEGSSAIGVNGNQGDNSAGSSGAAYVFRYPEPCPCPWTDLGHGLSGTHGVPALAGDGQLIAGSDVLLSLSSAKEIALAALVVGTSEIQVPFKGGTLLPSPEMLHVFVTTFAGEINIHETLTVGPQPGTALYVQFWIQDVAGPNGFSASNALSRTAP